MKKLLAAAAIAAIAGAPALAESSVLGAWDTSVDAGGQVFEATVTFSETDGAYAVDWVDQGAAGFEIASEISDLEVTDDSFSFVRTLDFQGQAFVITYSGMVDGDALTGTASSDMGEAPMTGSRSDAAAE